MDPLRLGLEQPGWLALLAVVPLLVLARERNGGGHPPWVSFVALGGRGVAVTALALALARPYREAERPDRSVAIAVDGSASVGAAARESALAAVAPLLDGAAERRVPVAIVVSGEPPRRVDGILGLRDALAKAQPVDEGTDLRSLIEAAAAALPEARVSDIVLLSDGAATHGDAQAAARVLSARDIPLHTFPLPESASPPRIASVEGDQDRYEGDTISVVATLVGATTGTIALLDGSTVLASAPLAGVRAALRVPSVPEGTHSLDLELREDGGATVASAPFRLRVLPKPRLLAVGDDAGTAIVRAAASAENPPLLVDAQRTLPDPLPDAVRLLAWLDPDLSGADGVRAASVAAWVRAGGRLVVTGGPHGLTTDLPAVEPFADALPARFPKRTKKERAPLTVVYCLDISDSMAGGGKFELAAAALAQSVHLLPEQARVGLLGFADFPQWIAEIAPFDAAAPLVAKLRAVPVRGGTNLFSAIEAAGDALNADEALVKHVVVLSDGHSTTTFARHGDVVTSLRNRDVTVSTIAVTKGADRGELERIASAGGGRAWFAPTFDQLPKLFLDELMTVTRTNKVDEEVPLLGVRGARALLRLGDEPWVPPVRGYVRGEQKGGSQLAVATRDGRPVLLSWRYGRGDVVLLTTDAGGPWTAGWDGWEGLPKLWQGILDVALRPDPAVGTTLRIEVHGQKADVSFDAVDAMRNPRNDLVVTAILDRADGEVEVPLPPTGPGRYGTRIVLGPGATLIRAAAIGTDEASAPPPPGGERLGSVFAEPPDEVRVARSNPALLRALSQATDGRFGPAPAAILDRDAPPRVDRVPLAPYVLLAAMALLALDVLARRLLALRLP